MKTFDSFGPAGIPLHDGATLPPGILPLILGGQPVLLKAEDNGKPDWSAKVLEGNENIKDFGLYLGILRTTARHRNG